MKDRYYFAYGSNMNPVSYTHLDVYKRQNLYNVEAFNRCENNNEVLLAFKSWESVHPLIRIIPVEWDYTCLLYTSRCV